MSHIPGEKFGVCRYCGVDIFHGKRPRKIDACNEHKHRHYREKDPEKYRERLRRQRAAWPERSRELNRNWAKNNPEKNRAKNHRGMRTINGRFTHGKHRAKRFGLEWSLTKDQHQALISQPCHYCYGPLAETGSGLDRKDSSKGYTIDNVVPCCPSCNQMKWDVLSYEEMMIAMGAVLIFRRQNRLKVING